MPSTHTPGRACCRSEVKASIGVPASAVAAAAVSVAVSGPMITLSRADSAAAAAAAAPTGVPAVSRTSSCGPPGASASCAPRNRSRPTPALGPVIGSNTPTLPEGGGRAGTLDCGGWPGATQPATQPATLASTAARRTWDEQRCKTKGPPMSAAETTAGPPGGELVLVSTPIGNLADISARALDALRSADLVLCEDTRVTSRLLTSYGIAASASPLHEHNEDQRIPALLDAVREGRRIALVSDAGTPLVSDPGFRLVRAALAAGLRGGRGAGAPTRRVTGASR